MQKRVFIGFAFFLVAGILFAQAPYREAQKSSTREFITSPMQSIPYTGLLDASRISMGHQMGMSYSSLGGTGFTQGYYLNTLAYRFKSPVLLRLRMGVTNNPFSSAASYGPGTSPLGNMLGDAEFFGGADLDWRPKDNLLFRFSIDKMPPGMYYNNPYANRWGMGRYDNWGMGMFGYPAGSGYRSNHEREVLDGP